MSGYHFILTRDRRPAPEPWTTRTFEDFPTAKLNALRAVHDTRAPITVTRVERGSIADIVTYVPVHGRRVEA